MTNPSAPGERPLPLTTEERTDRLKEARYVTLTPRGMIFDDDAHDEAELILRYEATIQELESGSLHPDRLSPPAPSDVDSLLDAFQRACAAVVEQGDSNISATSKERAILRNEIRSQLIRRSLGEIPAADPSDGTIFGVACKLGITARAIEYTLEPERYDADDVRRFAAAQVPELRRLRDLLLNGTRSLGEIPATPKVQLCDKRFAHSTAPHKLSGGIVQQPCEFPLGHDGPCGFNRDESARAPEGEAPADTERWNALREQVVRMLARRRDAEKETEFEARYINRCIGDVLDEVLALIDDKPAASSPPATTAHYCGKGLPLEFLRVGPCPQCKAEATAGSTQENDQ